jgi:hypothetical protein
MAAKKKVSDSKSGSKARDLARLVDQVGREVHGLGYASDLHPVQWAALRFLSDADPESRTVSGVLEKLSGADRKVLGDVLAKVQAALAGARA